MLRIESLLSLSRYVDKRPYPVNPVGWLPLNTDYLLQAIQEFKVSA
jgi:hypothetical protein